MQQIAGAQRLLAPQQAGVRSRARHQLVAFTGFKSASAMHLGSGQAPGTLQAHVSKAIKAAARQRGVRCMRVTRMMFERFTEKAIKVVMLAQEEARRLGHNFVGTEQILLGLIGESTGKFLKISGQTRSFHFLAPLQRYPAFSGRVFSLTYFHPSHPSVGQSTTTNIHSPLSFPPFSYRYRRQGSQVYGRDPQGRPRGG